MRTTISVDDTLFEQAQACCPAGTDTANVIKIALETLVRLEAAKRLAELGGKSPTMKNISRR